MQLQRKGPNALKLTTNPTDQTFLPEPSKSVLDFKHNEKWVLWDMLFMQLFLPAIHWLLGRRTISMNQFAGIMLSSILISLSYSRQTTENAPFLLFFSGYVLSNTWKRFHKFQLNQSFVELTCSLNPCSFLSITSFWSTAHFTAFSKSAMRASATSKE